MEFPGISGTSGESSSFRHGFFEMTVTSIEIVLANGEVSRAPPEKNSDLFHGAASSWRTLGIILLLEIRLIEAKQFVSLTYFPFSSMEECELIFEKAAANSATDYLDGILYSADRGVICSGTFTDKLTVQRRCIADKDLVPNGGNVVMDVCIAVHDRICLRSGHKGPIVALYEQQRKETWGSSDST